MSCSCVKRDGGYACRYASWLNYLGEMQRKPLMTKLVPIITAQQIVNDLKKICRYENKSILNKFKKRIKQHV